MWRRIEAEGVQWEVRATSAAEMEGAEEAAARDEEILEFRALDGIRPPRRVAVPARRLSQMDDAALLSAFQQARPIGGDFYGRPGKRMGDVNR